MRRISRSSSAGGTRLPPARLNIVQHKTSRVVSPLSVFTLSCCLLLYITGSVCCGSAGWPGWSGGWWGAGAGGTSWLADKLRAVRPGRAGGTPRPSPGCRPSSGPGPAPPPSAAPQPPSNPAGPVAARPRHRNTPALTLIPLTSVTNKRPSPVLQVRNRQPTCVAAAAVTGESAR